MGAAEKGFVHLHNHSEYSLLDGAARLEQMIVRAKELGMPSIALTDHGVMYGAVDFYKLAKKHGIKPIIGCEVYVARRGRFDKEANKDGSPYHLVLLAENNVGYTNLMKLVSKAFTEGFYYKPRVDKELLKQYNQGIIALSACLAGEIPSYLLDNQYDLAQQAAREYSDMFDQDRFYLELQDHGLKGQAQVNNGLIKLSRELEIGLVATNDVHYVMPDDSRIHEILLCIQTSKTLDDPNRMDFGSKDFYLKNREEMELLFGEYQEAMDNTLTIAERCNVEFDFGNLHLPHYEVPREFDLDSYLSRLCTEGLDRRYQDVQETHQQRLKHELHIIKKMGYSGYFLIVWDLVNFAKKKGILVGPGRGSAAGSLVAYCLGITDIDPLEYNLLFERFLNPERVNMPDVDIDFCYERRGEIIDYVGEKYGHDHVAQIITFGTMAAKAAVRDVGRALGMTPGEVDKVAKLVPNELGITLERALKISTELKGRYENEEQIRELMDMAKALEGMPRHASTHAAGLVIAKEELTKYVPLQSTSDGAVTTQFPMHTVEELGLLKMDILGLRTLTVIDQCLSLINENFNKDINLNQVLLDDNKTFSLLGRGDTVGVFQLESSGMRTILKNLKPEQFRDIIALVALYRPGPLGSGMVDDFISRKHGETQATYLHEALKPILEETYGVILYQEQVMHIASTLAGFSLGEADLLRRAMGKKKPEVIAGLREKFIQGAAVNKVASDISAKVFDLMEYFAGYGFNKSHSAAYALVAYQTAYLKAHHPVEFMCALISSIMNNPDKVPLYIDECRRMGIEILPPDVSESRLDFTVVGDSIRFGLAAVKNVGRGAIESIIEARASGGGFVSLSDFCHRVDLRQVNRRVLESLIKCGAFGSLGVNRAQLLAMLDKCLNVAQQYHKDRLQGKVSLMDLVDTREQVSYQTEQVPELPEFSAKELLAMEKEILGFYVSGHPVSSYQKYLEKNTSHSIAQLAASDDGVPVIIGGIINSIRRTITRRGEAMAYINLEDTTGVIETLVFPRAYMRLNNMLEEDKVVLLRGKLSNNEDQLKVFADKISWVPEENDYKLYLKLGNDLAQRNKLEKIKKILGSYQGTVPIYFYFPEADKTVLADQALWVDLNEKLIESLKDICGKDGVKLVAG